VVAGHLDAMLADLEHHVRDLCACTTLACIEATNRRYADLVRRRSYPTVRDADLDSEHKRLFDDVESREKICRNRILCRGAVDAAQARGESHDEASRRLGCTAVIP